MATPQKDPPDVAERRGRGSVTPAALAYSGCPSDSNRRSETVKEYTTLIAALILSAAILGAAWLHALTGRYQPADDIFQPVVDTWTGEVCLGTDPAEVQCVNARTGDVSN